MACRAREGVPEFFPLYILMTPSGPKPRSTQKPPRGFCCVWRVVFALLTPPLAARKMDKKTAPRFAVYGKPGHYRDYFKLMGLPQKLFGVEHAFQLFAQAENRQALFGNLNADAGFGVAAGIAGIMLYLEGAEAAYFNAPALNQGAPDAVEKNVDNHSGFFCLKLVLVSQCTDQLALVHALSLSGDTPDGNGKNQSPALP